MKNIGIIGYGNMGSSIAGRLKSKYRVFVFDQDRSKTRGQKDLMVACSAIDLVLKAEIIILAVKPQDFKDLLLGIKKYCKNKLIISIAAGISTKDIEGILGRVRVVRVMPNIGVIVAKAISYICQGRFTNENDLSLAEKLFDSIGKTVILKDEKLMHAATAVGGSGPGFRGYLFDKMSNEDFIQSLTVAAEGTGLPADIAAKSASAVSAATVCVMEALGITPLELTKKVTSKRGTTEAGLKVLRKGGSLKEAVMAALKRSKELARGVRK